MAMMRIAAILIVAVTVCWMGGCEKKQPPVEQMIELLMPQQVRIVEAFTGFRSFDEDDVPDGIELLLQPVDSFGDPVKMAGTVRVELYEYLQASGNRDGRRLCDPWEVPLQTREDQSKYWNNVTGMYEIPLEIPAGVAATGLKFVLVVTYNSPLGTHLTDESVLTAPKMATSQ